MTEKTTPTVPLDLSDLRSPRREALRLAGAYLILAATYILVSTQFARVYARSAEQMANIETVKGLGFIVVTAIALWLLNVRQLTRVRRRDAQFGRMDRALQNAGRSVLAGTIASTVAHDINNGLMSVTMALEELQDRVRTDSESSALAHEARTGLGRIAEWNRRLFDLGGERLIGEVRPFELAQLLRSTCQLAQRHRSLQAVVLEQELPAAAPFRGSASMMQRAVLNLLLNAAEAAGPNTRVRLALTQGEYGLYRVTVDDSGPGVPPEIRERILEPFYTTKTEGTGLGLASVVACVNFHRGTVTIDDSPLGGARFTLLLA